MPKEFVDPLRRHHDAPLPVLEVLLALVPSLAGLLNHLLDPVRMERVQHFEEEVAFREAIVIVRQVVLYIWPLVNLRVDVLDGEPGPVWDRFRRHFLLLKYLLLTIENGLKKDELAFGCFRQEIAA